MEGDENRDISATCSNLDYTARETGEQHNHDLDWQMRINVEGHRPLESMTASEIEDQVRAQVEEAAAFSIWGKTPDSAHAPDPDVAQPRVHVGYDMSAERHEDWESHHQPFLAQFDLSGTTSIDSRAAIDADQGWLLAKKEMAAYIARQVANFVVENVDHQDADSSRSV